MRWVRENDEGNEGMGKARRKGCGEMRDGVVGRRVMGREVKLGERDEGTREGSRGDRNVRESNLMDKKKKKKIHTYTRTHVEGQVMERLWR